MADIVIPQEQVTTDDLLSLIDSQSKDLVKPPVVNEDSSVVMDSLEAARVNTDKAVIDGTQPPDPSQLGIDISQAKQGINIRDKYASVFEEENQIVKSSMIETLISDNRTTSEDKLTLLQHTRTLPQADTLFSDYETGVHSLHDRNINKQLAPRLKTLSAEEESEAWAQMEWESAKVAALGIDMLTATKHMANHPFAQYIAGKKEQTAAEKETHKELWFDEFMYNTMFIPEFIHGLFDDETSSEMEAFRQLINEKKSRGGVAAQTGAISGEAASLFLDPFIDVGGIVVTGGVKTSRAIAKASRLMKTTKGMEKTLGPITSMAVTKSSHGSLVDYLSRLQKLDSTKLEQLRTLSKSDDRLANKLSEAFTDFDAGNVPNGPARLQESAAATMAVKAGVSADVSATDNLTDAVLTANAPVADSSVDAVVKAIDAEDITTHTMISDIPESGVVDPIGEYGRQVENVKKVSDTAAVHTERMFMQRSVDQFVEGMSHQRVYNRELSAGPDATGWQGKSGSRLSGFFFNPRATFKGAAKEDLVLNPLLNIKEEQRLRKGFEKSLGKIFKNVKGNDAKVFEHIVQEGNDFGINWNIVPGGLQRPNDPDSFIKASPKVIDSWKAYRRIHDDAARITNDAMRLQMRDKGYKFFESTDEVAFPVTVRDPEKRLLDVHGNDVQWTAKNKEAGDTMWYMSAKGERGGVANHVLLSKEQVEQSLKDIPGTYNPLNNKDGYMHVKYTDDFIITEVKMDDSGNVLGARKAATARTHVESAEFAKKFSRPDEGVYYVSDRIDGPTTDLVTTSGMFDNQFRMTDAQFSQFTKALSDGGRPQEFIDALKDSRKRYGYKAQPYQKARGSRLIQAKTARLEGDVLTGDDAPILQSADAAAYYLNKVARYTANVPYNERLLKSFLKSYGSSLIEPDNAFSALKPIKEIGFKRHQEIAAYQRQLQNLVNRPSKLDEFLNAGRQAAVDKVELVDNKYVSEMGRLINKVMPTTRGAGSAVKNITRQALMGVGAIIQAPLQFSTAFINSMLISSGGALVRGELKQALNVAAKTQTDFIGLLMPVATKGERNFTKAGKETNDLITRSGIMDGVDLEAFGSHLQDPRNIQAISTGFIRKATNTVSGWPIWGEKAGQIYGWLAARREIESMVKSGKHPTLTAVDVAKKTDKYVDTITSRGALLSHNMSRANRPGMSTGDILSTVTMFKRFGFDQAGLMFNMGRELKTSEVFALWAGYIGAFGVRGVPGYTDATVAAEKIENIFSEVPDADGKWLYEVPLAMAKASVDAAEALGLPSPEAKSFFLAYQQGLPAAMTEGQFAMAPRMAVDGMFTSFTQGASWDENMLGASYSVTKKLLKQTKLSSRIVFEAIEEFGIDNIPAESLGAAAREAVKPFVGVEKIRQAAKANITGVIRSSTGQVLKEDATFEDVLVLSLGETPGDLRMVQEYRSMMFKRKDAMKSWLKSVAKQAASVGVESPNTSDLMIDNIQKQLEDAGYSQVGMLFQQQAIREKMKLEMPVDQKVQFDGIVDPLVDQQLQEILGLLSGE